MMKSRCKPSRIDFDAVDVYQIQRILSTGDLDSLTPAEREYYSLMEMVRGLRARISLPGGNKIVTKAGIIKLLKSEAYGLSDWMARQIYADAINFFYTDDTVRPKAWANLYAEKAEKLADAAALMGDFKSAKAFIDQAAKLRGCYDDPAPEIPEELLNNDRVVIYATDAAAIGAPKADRKRLKAFVDSIPDVPEVARQRVLEDAGILKKDLLNRLISDAKEFGEDNE